MAARTELLEGNVKHPDLLDFLQLSAYLNPFADPDDDSPVNERNAATYIERFVNLGYLRRSGDDYVTTPAGGRARDSFTDNPLEGTSGPSKTSRVTRGEGHMNQVAKDGPSLSRFTLAELIEKIREHEVRKAKRKKAEKLARGSAQIISLAEWRRR